MKRLIIVAVVLVLFAAIAVAIDPVYIVNKAGLKVNPGQLHTERALWAVFDTSTSSGDEPNDLAVAERTYATVAAAAEGGDDEISTLDLRTAARNNWNRLRFRCTGITDGQSITYQIYLGTLGPGGTDCVLVKAAQLAFTVGTQVSTTATYEFADTLTVTEGYSWPVSWLSSSPTGNLVAEAAVDLMGADYIVAVPTTVGCNCQLLVKGY